MDPSLSDALVATQTASYGNDMDQVLGDCMERLGTRLSILETELKYAWRALDLLSQEYLRIWQRLEKLEGLLYEQQAVISQLLEFYSTGAGPAGSGLDHKQLEVAPAQEVGEDVVATLHGAGSSSASSAAASPDLRHLLAESEQLTELLLRSQADEAFYRSLNSAHREDLTQPQITISSNEEPLGMIWEVDEGSMEEAALKAANAYDNAVAMEQKADSVFSSFDYKDYKCDDDKDMAQMTELSALDQVTLAKISELDRISTQLQQDTATLKELQSRMHEYNEQEASALKSSGLNMEAIRSKTSDSLVDQTLRQLYVASELDRWSYSTLNLNNGAGQSRPSSRMSSASGATDPEISAVLGSPNRGLGSSLNASIYDSKSPTGSLRARTDYLSCTVPNEMGELKSDLLSPTSPPPPPAPSDCGMYNLSPAISLANSMSIINSLNASQSTRDMLSPNSPRSPKSPRHSPKHQEFSSKPESAASRLGLLGHSTAKSDSGLSSLSSWSGLEKSPPSPRSRSDVPVGQTSPRHQGYCYHSDAANYLTSSSLMTQLQSKNQKMGIPSSLVASSAYVPSTLEPTASPKHRFRTGSPFSEYLLKADANENANYSAAGSNTTLTYSTLYTRGSSSSTFSTYSPSQLPKPDITAHTPLVLPVHSPPSPASSHRLASGSSVTDPRAASYRSRFATGNMTDALSYYPTNSSHNYDIVMTSMLPSAQCSGRINLTPSPGDTSSSIKSADSNRYVADAQYLPSSYPIEPRKYQAPAPNPPPPPEPRPSRIPLSQVQGNVYHQSLDSAGVIVSQSGYISIASNINSSSTETRPSKKLQRRATFKSAMSTVSNWIPDLHLKRNRSHSLPGGSENDEAENSEQKRQQPPPSTSSGIFTLPRKRRKNKIVSTMSGLLQKARRKGPRSTSMSDGEQSESEWSTRYSSTASDQESEEGIFLLIFFETFGFKILSP